MASAAALVGAISRIMLLRSRVPASVPLVPLSASTASMVVSPAMSPLTNCIVAPIFCMACPISGMVVLLLLAAKAQ